MHINHVERLSGIDASEPIAPTDKQRLFVFVDSLTSTGSTKAAPYIMEIHNGQTYIRKQFESDFYASDPDRFEDIVGWMTSNIDAESFGLVLWGHATGWIVDPDSIVRWTSSLPTAAT